MGSVVPAPLETISTKSVMKGFIAVGTTINRTEDLAVAGRGEPTSPSVERVMGLTGLCMEVQGVFGIVEVVPDASPNVKRCSGFLDAAVHVASLQAAKNLLVIGGAVKSVWLGHVPGVPVHAPPHPRAIQLFAEVPSYFCDL
ncbi:hypothetical protein V8D89_004568 [Ganoderma adspersum]